MLATESDQLSFEFALKNVENNDLDKNILIQKVNIPSNFFFQNYLNRI